MLRRALLLVLALLLALMPLDPLCAQKSTRLHVIPGQQQTYSALQVLHFSAAAAGCVQVLVPGAGALAVEVHASGPADVVPQVWALASGPVHHTSPGRLVVLTVGAELIELCVGVDAAADQALGLRAEFRPLAPVERGDGPRRDPEPIEIEPDPTHP